MPSTNEVLQQGRYRITHQLGQNGAGAVYEALDTVLETHVVLKEISVKLKKVTTSNQLETLKLAFANEAKTLTELKHDSLLNVRDYFSEIDRHYLVTESVDGNYLSEHLERNKKPFALSYVIAWADQLLDALNYLHAHVPPVIHHDIKPQNIKLTSAGKVKLLIFGAAKDPDARASAAMASQSFDAASLNYLPLEQIWSGLDLASQKVITNSYDERSEEILKRPADAKSDIYSLGATLYHLLAARLPVDALTRSIDILEGKEDPLAHLTQLNSHVPAEISNIVMKAMEIKRENRFDSALMMRQILRTAVVRVKERMAKEAEETKTQQPAVTPEMPPEPPTSAPSLQERPQIDAEEKRQLEMVKAQLLEAERRAAEAEKRLLEKENQKVVDSEPLAAAAESLAEFIEAIEPETTRAEDISAAVEIVEAPEAAKAAEIVPAVKNIEPRHAEPEFAFSYDEPKTEKSGLLRMAAVAGVLIIFGGAGVGAWMFASGSGSSVKPAMSLTSPAQPESSATVPVNGVENTPETTAQTISASPDAADETAGAPGAKPALQSGQPQAKKQPTPATAAAAKTPAPKKKAVTVDDLINDN